tara:strand:+ start:1049 stop:1840 length:792 start_codon:yes stop_codon:yes gene_type:complete
MNENEQYHNDTTRISKSGTDLINKTPAHYYERYLNPDRIKVDDTKALIIGSAFHAYILERDEFNSMFIILPEFSGKGSRDKKEQFILNNSGRQPLSINDFQTIVGMSEALNRHPIASKLINESGFAERAFHWTDKTTGAKCKCKPDRFNTTRNLIIDLKSTEDASEKDFKYSAKKFRYYVQDAFYSDGMSANGVNVAGFVFISVEKSPPYLVQCFSYTEDEKEFGRAEYKKNLQTYVDCKAKNVWPGYPETITNLEIPGMGFL